MKNSLSDLTGDIEFGNLVVNLHTVAVGPLLRFGYFLEIKNIISQHDDFAIRYNENIVKPQ